MRKPSRTMPPIPAIPMTLTGYVLLSSIGVCVIWVIHSTPVLLLPIAIVGVLTSMTDLNHRHDLESLAEKRQGESICTFARAFDYRAIDTWIIRAVFEELQCYCRFGARTLPLRPTDSLLGVLAIDEEELECLVTDIATRTGRSLDDSEKNPMYSRVTTVSDLVMFFTHQPILVNH